VRPGARKDNAFTYDQPPLAHHEIAALPGLARVGSGFCALRANRVDEEFTDFTADFSLQSPFAMLRISISDDDDRFNILLCRSGAPGSAITSGDSAASRLEPLVTPDRGRGKILAGALYAEVDPIKTNISAYLFSPVPVRNLLLYGMPQPQGGAVG